jgi:hypothetical protein
MELLNVWILDLFKRKIIIAAILFSCKKSLTYDFIL